MKPPESRKAELAPNTMSGEKSHAETAARAEFKMTELGPIPVDWEVKRLGECGEYISGAVFPINRQGGQNGDYPFFKVSDFNNSGNENQLRISNNYVSKTVARELGCNLIPALSIVFAKIGAAIALERKRIVAQDSCIDNNMMAFHVNDNNDSSFFVEVLRCIRFADFSESTALPALNAKCLRDCVVRVPPLAEQRRIAGALSDVDELISALGKLIEKKRNIKTGAMQQLLTGKTRLPGFGANSPRSNHSHAEAQRGRGIEFKQTELGPIPMDWEVKRFDDAFEHIPSKPFQIQSSEYQEGGRFQVVDQGQMEIVGYTDDDDKLFHVPSGGVIVFGDHTRIIKFREFDFVVGADGTQLLVGKEDCTRFLFYVLQQLDIPNLGYARHFKYVKEGRYAIPPTFSEQKAIAAVLSDMDAEIAALEADRAKYERIKSGMMQELLTGKTRLKP